MELILILRTIRRHWLLILVLTVVGAVIGVATTGFDSGTVKSRTYYKATTTLVVDLSQRTGQSNSAFQSLDQLGIYTTTGDVPDAVAKKVGSGESGRKLAEHIITTTNSGTSTIAITAAESSSEEATRVANAFAAELVANLDKRSLDAYGRTRDQLQARLDSLTNQQNALYPQIAANPPNVDNLKSQLTAIGNQYRITYDSYSQLAAAGPPTTRFSTLQKAAAIPIDRQEYFARLGLGATSRNNLSTSQGSSALDESLSGRSTDSPVSGPAARGLLGAFLGLLLGVGLAFLRERLDRRILHRSDAEEAFHLPVLAEVPQITKSQQRERELVASTAPLSRFTEAFRAVRSSVLFTRAAIEAEAAAPTARGVGNGTAPGGSLFEPDPDDPLVVMISSASPGEGKTTTTANLAAVFAEAGSSVLVVNCDFRRPALHRFFGIDDEPRRVHETSVPGVKVVTNVLTDPASNPAQVLAAQRQVVAAARGRFDVILLDTAPLLTANDAVELVSSADLVLLVARIGVTRSDTAERSMALLTRLDVPLAGVILMGVSSATNDYYYYYQPGRVSSARGGSERSRGRASTANGNGRAAESEMFVPESDTEERAQRD